MNPRRNLSDNSRSEGQRPKSGVPRRLTFLLVFLWLLYPATGAHARSHEPLAGETAVPDAVLDSMRGGFSIGDMNFNFSFRSVTWVNNVLLTETDLTLANNIITSLKDVINNPVLKDLGLVPVSGPSGGNASPQTNTSTLLSRTTPDNTVVNVTPPAKLTNFPNGNTGEGGSGPVNTPHTGTLASLSSQNGSHLTTPSSLSGKTTLSSPTTTLISVGSGNSGVTGNAFANAGSLTTVIQNNANNIMIQHVTQLNGIISNMGPVIHTTNMILRINQAATLGSILSRY